MKVCGSQSRARPSALRPQPSVCNCLPSVCPAAAQAALPAAVDDELEEMKRLLGDGKGEADKGKGDKGEEGKKE